MQGEGNAEGSAAGAGCGLDPAVWQELQRVMRGMDPAQLLDLVQPDCITLTPASLDGEPAPSGTAPVMASRGGRSGGGERGYDPAQDQLVVLLLARIDKQPAVGADMVQAQVEPSGRVTLSSPGLDALLPR